MRKGRTYTGSSPASRRCPQAPWRRRGGTSLRRDRSPSARAAGARPLETEVLVPLENVAVQGDRIVLRNLTEEQVKALPKYTTDDKTYRELDGSQSVSLSEQK